MLKLSVLSKHKDILANKEDECVEIWRQTGEIVSAAGTRSGPSEWWCSFQLADRWLSGLQEDSFRYSSPPLFSLSSSPGKEPSSGAIFQPIYFLMWSNLGHLPLGRLYVVINDGYLAQVPGGTGAHLYNTDRYSTALQDETGQDRYAPDWSSRQVWQLSLLQFYYIVTDLFEQLDYLNIAESFVHPKQNNRQTWWTRSDDLDIHYTLERLVFFTPSQSISQQSRPRCQDPNEIRPRTGWWPVPVTTALSPRVERFMCVHGVAHSGWAPRRYVPARCWCVQWLPGWWWLMSEVIHRLVLSGIETSAAQMSWENCCWLSDRLLGVFQFSSGSGKIEVK